MEKTIKCEICGKRMQAINHAHLSTHNMTPKQYKEKFPGKSLYSEKSLLKMRENLIKGRKTMASDEYVPKYRSKAEVELEEFIRQMGVVVYPSNQKLLGGVELDLVMPNERVAIEYNGLRYHSESFGKKGRSYHKNKTDLCYEKGYRLIHIFEDDYKSNKKIIFTKIASILGKNPYPKVYGRQTEIKPIVPEKKTEFLSKHHIQGPDKAKINLGAFKGEELIAVMTFKPYRPKNSDKSEAIWELSRFATHTEYQGVGIASKMVKYFERNIECNKIYSFGDLTWVDPDNNMYLSIGFSVDHIVPPDYQYAFKFRERVHKFGFDKKNISKKFPEIYSPEKTEWQMMQEAGYDRIWDCGKIRYVLHTEDYVAPKSANTKKASSDQDLIEYMERATTNIDGRLLTEEEIERRRKFYEENMAQGPATEDELYVEKEDQNNLSVNKDFDLGSVGPVKNNKASYSYDMVYRVCEGYVFANKSIRGLAKELDVSPSAIKTMLTNSGVNILSNKRKYVGGKKAVSKRYQEKHKEKLSEKYKEYRENNKEKLQEYHKEWYEKNRQEQLDKKKATYIKGKYDYED